MRGGRFHYSPQPVLAELPAEEKAVQAHKEECELRLARRMNARKEDLNTPWDGHILPSLE